MTETINNAPAPASEGAVDSSELIERLPPKKEKSSNLFMDVDDAVEEALAKAKPAKTKPKQLTRRQAEAEVDELLNDGMGFKGRELEEDDTPPDDDEEDTRPAPRKPKVEEDEEPEEKPAKRKPKAEPEEQEQESEDAEPPEPEYGTKKKPYRREEMPEDQFAEVKVDGEKQVVSLRELVDNYSGKKAVEKRLAEIGNERVTMQRQVDEAKEEVKKNAQTFEEILRDPDRMYEILTRNEAFEKTLQRLFERRYDDLSTWEKNPTARARFLQERNQRVFNAQQQALQQEHQRMVDEQNKRAYEERRIKVLVPGWNEGLRQAGLLNEKNLPEELGQTAQGWLNAKLGSKPATSEDVTQAVLFAVRFLKLKPSSDPPPVRRPNIVPRSNGRPPARGTVPANDKRWEGMTKAQKAMDPDYMSRNIRLRG